MAKSFADWMKAVDAATYKKVGLSIHDLADQPFRDWYTDGITPSQAVTLTLQEEGF